MSRNPLTQDWSGMGHYAAVSSVDLDTALTDCQREKRAIRSQEFRSRNAGLSRRNPLTTDNGSRYLVAHKRTNRAYFQSDDIGDAVVFALEHEGLTLIDLGAAPGRRKRLIAQYLGGADKHKTYSPAYDPTTNRFGMVTETLLRDRKKAPGKVEVTNTTPIPVLIQRILNHEPLIQGKKPYCSHCGMSEISCTCAADPRKIKQVDKKSRLAAEKITVSDEWLKDAIQYQGYIRYGKYRLCPLASAWIEESI